MRWDCKLWSFEYGTHDVQSSLTIYRRGRHGTILIYPSRFLEIPHYKRKISNNCNLPIFAQMMIDCTCVVMFR